jgi:hypothetical protein
MHLDKEGKQVILYCDFILTVVPFSVVDIVLLQWLYLPACSG